jgi:hypothetical protein
MAGLIPAIHGLLVAKQGVEARNLRCLVIELRATEVDALVRWGYLKNETRNNARAIISALYAHLQSTLV